MHSDLIAKLAERLHDQGLTIYGEGKTKVGAAAIVDAAVATTLVLVAKEMRDALKAPEARDG